MTLLLMLLLPLLPRLLGGSTVRLLLLLSLLVVAVALVVSLLLWLVLRTSICCSGGVAVGVVLKCVLQVTTLSMPWITRGVVGLLLSMHKRRPPGSHARRRGSRHCITGGLVVLTPPRFSRLPRQRSPLYHWMAGRAASHHDGISTGCYLCSPPCPWLFRW